MTKIFLLISIVLMATAVACVAPTAPVAGPPASLQPAPTATAQAPDSLRPAPTPTPAAEPNTRPPEAAPPNTRPPEPAPSASGFEPIAGAAVQFAAAELGMDAASIQVVSVESVEWRNSCLGVDKPGEMCMDVITPGYRVVLDVGGQEVAVHTNQDASVMRLADPAQGVPSVKPTSYDPAEIYALVVRQLYMVDHTFGQPPLFPVVYLLRQTDDSVGAPGSPADGETISPADQERVVSLLSDLPARFVWVDSREDVPVDSIGVVADGGAIMTLGNIADQPDGSLQVPAGIYIGSLAAGGQTYVLQVVDGAWQITGIAGPRWMS